MNNREQTRVELNREKVLSRELALIWKKGKIEVRG